MKIIVYGGLLNHCAILVMANAIVKLDSCAEVLIPHRRIQYPACPLPFIIMWCTFKYQKSNRDAYLVNVHGDHAELLKVNPAKGCSEHIMLSAPVAVIRDSVKRLLQQGYKKCDRIELSLRGLASN